MLKYKCLVLDHDDTVVQSEATVNYPCFLLALEKFRPGEYMDYPEFVDWCFRYEFTDFLRIRYGFTDEELLEEYHMWMDYARTHTPPAYEGIEKVIYEQKRRGGLVCVASLSGRENILRDYRTHFDMEPDLLFTCDDPRPERKPNPHPLLKIMETYGLSPADLLMVDDLKTGWQMSRAAGVPIAFAGWSRVDFPQVTKEMTQMCDLSFQTTEALYHYLFEV